MGVGAGLLGAAHGCRMEDLMSKRRTAALAVAILIGGGPAVAAADVVQDWNAHALAATNAQNPFLQARSIAIVQLAVFEAVNAVVGDYEPYLGTVSAPAGASVNAAAIEAAYRALLGLGVAGSLGAAYTAALAAIPDGQAKADGIAVGSLAAQSMLANRTGDGASPAAFFAPTSSDPGVWQPYTGCPVVTGVQVGILFHWQNLRPFGIDSSSQFRSSPPAQLQTGRYARDYMETMDVGELNSALRPWDRADVARYFAAAAAVHVWSQAASQVMTQKWTSISENARVFALIAMAVSDGLVSSMETKYHYNFWRPITAIRAGDSDGNEKTAPDSGWTPFIATPCFPSYPSAHASASYAARKIVAEILGGVNHWITLSHPNTPVTLSYTKFSEITDDIDDARVYGGIHFRFDQAAGAVQGRAVGLYVCQNNLRPISGDSGTCRE
jgi:hypothetical protein